MDSTYLYWFIGNDRGMGSFFLGLTGKRGRVRGGVAVVEIIPEYGIVALFDILGYRNLVLNNKIEKTA
jgi:hypothetical protein